jgi:hypothetical protein
MHSPPQILDVPKSFWPHSSRRAENDGDVQHILEPHTQAPIEELAFYDVHNLLFPSPPGEPAHAARNPRAPPWVVLNAAHQPVKPDPAKFICRCISANLPPVPFRKSTMKTSSSPRTLRSRVLHSQRMKALEDNHRVNPIKVPLRLLQTARHHPRLPVSQNHLP